LNSGRPPSQPCDARPSARRAVEYERSNEKITITGDQAMITADIAESIVVEGQKVDTKARERATVESFDGTLMLTQLVANQVL
jgi:nicotinamide riboside kinase